MMTEDLPMFDAYNAGAGGADDAEMIAEDEFDYEMQEEPTSGSKEYDMTREDQLEYEDEDVIQAEPIVEPSTLIVDMPSVEGVPSQPQEVSQTMPIPQPAPAEPIITQPEFVTQPVSMPESSEVVPDAWVPYVPDEVPLATVIPETVPAVFLVSPTTEVAPHLTRTSPVIHIPELPAASSVVDSVTVTASPPSQDATAEPQAPEQALQESVLVQETPAGEAPAQDVVPSPDATHEAQPATTCSPAEVANVIPPIAFYFDEQVFALFATPEADASTPPHIVLLTGRHDLYAAPLSHLLNAIKVQESAFFPGVEECVLGLEYQDLDLCIDANCKYADRYSLQDLSNALLACGHTTIEFNIFQLSDFETSLTDRLKGNLPQFVATNSVAGGEVDSTSFETQAIPQEAAPADVQGERVSADTDHHKQSATEENQYEQETAALEDEFPEEEVGDLLTGAGPETVTDPTHEHQGPTNPTDATQAVEVTQSDKAAFGKEPDQDSSESAKEASEKTSNIGEPSVEEVEDEDLADPGTVANHPSVSSATLESSTHGDDEPEYQVEEVEDEDTQDIARRKDEITVLEVQVTSVTTEEQYEDGDDDGDGDVEGDELAGDEQDEQPTAADIGEEQTTDDALPVVPEQTGDEPTHQALENEFPDDESPDDVEGEGIAENDEYENEYEDNALDAGQEPVGLFPSPQSQEDEFAEYDDDLNDADQPQRDADSSLTVVAATVDVLSSKTAVAQERRQSSSNGKRALEEVDVAPEDVDSANHGLEAKRARVQ